MYLREASLGEHKTSQKHNDNCWRKIGQGNGSPKQTLFQEHLNNVSIRRKVKFNAGVPNLA